MAEHLADKEWVAAFEKPKGNPAAFKKPATTCLSPYLKFGCVSIRLFYSQLAQASLCVLQYQMNVLQGENQT